MFEFKNANIKHALMDGNLRDNLIDIINISYRLIYHQLMLHVLLTD